MKFTSDSKRCTFRNGLLKAFFGFTFNNNSRSKQIIEEWVIVRPKEIWGVTFFSVSLNQSQHETFWNINSEAYLGPCQTNNGFSRSLFFQKTPSQVSDRVLNTSLQNILNLFCKKSSRSHCFWFDGSTASDVLLVWCTFGLMEVLFQKYCFISFHLIY